MIGTLITETMKQKCLTERYIVCCTSVMNIVNLKYRKIWFSILLLVSEFYLSNGIEGDGRDTESSQEQKKRYKGRGSRTFQTGNVDVRKESQYLKYQNGIDIIKSHNVIHDDNNSEGSILLNPVDILICDVESSEPGSKIFYFDVDHTVNILLVKVITRQKYNATPQYTVYYPSGTFVDVDVGNVTVLISSNPKSKDLILSDTEPGKWKIEIEDNTTNSVIVRGNSIVDFNTKFVDDYGYTINSQPLAGMTVNLVVEIFGKELIENISRVCFLSSSGDTMAEIPTTRPVGRDGTIYAVECIIPRKEFMIGILGYDTFEMPLQRVQSKIIKPQVRSTSVTQKQTSQVTSTLLVQTTDWTSSEASTKASPFQTTGMISSEVMTTEKKMSTLNVETSSKFIDIYPPAFSTISFVDKCDENIRCSNRKWMVKFKVEDNESGIHRISVEDETKSSISFESYRDGVTNVPVHGNVSTNCCNSKVVIIVEDVQGNKGRFSVRYHHKQNITNDTSPQSTTIATENGTSFLKISGILIGSLTSILLVVIIVTVSIEFHKKVRVLCRPNNDIRVSRRLTLKLENIPDNKSISAEAV